MDDLFGRNRRRHYRRKAGPDCPLRVSLRVGATWTATHLLDTSAAGIGLAVAGTDLGLAMRDAVDVRIASADGSSSVDVATEVRHLDLAEGLEGAKRHTNLGLAMVDVAAFYRALPAWMHAHFNRRLVRRVPIDDEDVTGTLRAPQGNAHAITAIDMSLHGARLQADTLPLGSEAVLTLRLPDSRTSFELACALVYRELQMGSVGVRFLFDEAAAESEGRIALARFIISLQRQRGMSMSGITATVAE